MFYLTPFRSRRTKTGFHLVSDNWNDYGFYTLYKLYYVNIDNEETEIGYVKIGHKGQEEGSTLLEGIFDNIKEEYFSLGQSVDFYKTLRQLGDEVRLEYLIGMNDLAYFADLYEEVKEDKVVEVSLLREVNRKSVTQQFRRIAHGGAVLTEYNFKYKFETESSSSLFQFEVIPESLPPTNIHTIIGANGSGKTTSLKGIRDGYLNETLNEDFANAIFVSFSVFDKDQNYEFTDKSKEYYYVGVKKEGGNTKSQEELKLEFFNSIKSILSKKRHYYLHRMLEILNGDVNLENKGLIKILENFMEGSQNITPIENTSVVFSEIFDSLSSGHQIILLTVAKIIELIVEKTLILVDEPETHLHPPLLSAFVRAISEISIAENAVVILATHSPVVLQEVPRSCVSIIRKHGSQIKIKRPRFETFGENIGVLTEEVFKLEIPKTGFHTLLRKVVNKNLDYERVLELFNDELSIEAKSIVRTYINEISKE